MSTPLPSFVELMASLGLGGPDDAHDPRSSAKLSVLHSHSRSSSHSSTTSALSASASSTTSNVPPQPCNIYSAHQRSPSILVSSQEPSPERDLPGDIRRSRATTRYSPYGSMSHSRKASMPILNPERNGDRPARALSTSPRLSPISASFRGRRPRRPDNLTLSEADFVAYTPISSYVRRKTPQNSPTSPTFMRDSAQSHPLTVPALPTLLSPASFATQSSDSEDDDMDAIPDPEFALGESPRITTSPLWQSRYCDHIASPRISICAPLPSEETSRTQVAPLA